MLPRHLLRQVRRLHLWARRAVEDWLGGAYHSVFKGAGVAFEEVREYQPGDDVRSIDWHVTARMNLPFVKRFIEERERTVMLMVDISPSMSFGSGHLTKRQVAVELSALLALAALANNDRVGLLLFAHDVVKLVPPCKGTRHALRLLRDILVHGEATRSEAPPRRTDLSAALHTINQILHRRTVVVLVSDFLGSDGMKALERTAARHDLIAIYPQDPWERSLPDVGLLRLRDPETGQSLLIDTSDTTFRQTYEERALVRDEALRQRARGSRIDWIDVDTTGGHLEALQRFFERRRRVRGTITWRK
jgi:uncharacterized protein (DUF58 family)